MKKKLLTVFLCLLLSQCVTSRSAWIRVWIRQWLEEIKNTSAEYCQPKLQQWKVGGMSTCLTSGPESLCSAKLNHEDEKYPYKIVCCNNKPKCCPDNKSCCEEGSTCCENPLQSNMFNCCEEENAVCCDDMTCCPKDHTCAEENGQEFCQKNWWLAS